MRMNKISTAVVTTILALAVATPASSTADYADDASDAGTVTGGDVTAPEDRLPIDAEMAAKITESLKLGASLPNVTASELLEIEEELQSIRHLNPAGVDEALSVVEKRQAGETVSLNLVIASSDPVAIKNLGVVHQTQANRYYCGPATASMIVKYKGQNKSQTFLAGRNYLYTEQHGATRWQDKRMHTTLNKVLSITRYAPVQSPSTATLKNAFFGSIVANYPLAVSAVEFKNGAHYNGHPNQKIGHWLVGSGFSNWGNTIRMHDPAAPDPFPNAQRVFVHTTSGFQKFVQTNGIVY